MKLMVIGGGGREHAIIKKLRENPAVDTIWALPGNGGIAADATCVPVKATDIDGIVRFAKEGLGLELLGLAESPIKGREMGNVEYLSWWRKPIS